MIWDYLLEPANWTKPGDGIALLAGQHLLVTVLAVLAAAVVAIPLGVLIGHTGHGRFVGTGLGNAVRALPSLGLLVLVVTLLGTGTGPVIGVLALLALPPILTATAAGVSGADRQAVHAARALGMTGSQVLGRVEWPLALPLVIAGLRRATLRVVAAVTVAAFVSSGGLGRLLVSGQAAGSYAEMVAGAVLVAALAILLDLLLRLIGWLAARLSHPGRAGAPTLLASA